MRKLLAVLTVIAALALAAHVVFADIEIDEIAVADANSGTVIAASYAAGEDHTEPIVGNGYVSPLTTPQDGLMVTDYADAIDGNFVRGSWGESAPAIAWEVYTSWYLHGVAYTTSHVKTPGTTYRMSVSLDALIDDTNGSWQALNDSDTGLAEIVNESMFHNDNASVQAAGMIGDLAEIEFRYDLWVAADAEIDRAEMGIAGRGALRGTPIATENSVQNAGWIRLTDTDSGEILIPLTTFW